MPKKLLAFYNLFMENHSDSALISRKKNCKRRWLSLIDHVPWFYMHKRICLLDFNDDRSWFVWLNLETIHITGMYYKNLIRGTVLDGHFQPKGWPCWAEPRLCRGPAQHSHSEGWKCPSTTELHIGFFFLHNTTEKLKGVYVLYLGKNTRVRTEFLSQAKNHGFPYLVCKNYIYTIKTATINIKTNTMDVEQYPSSQ